MTASLARALVGTLLALSTAAPIAAQKPTTPPVPPALRLIPLLDGLRGDAPDGDLGRLGETAFGKEAAKVGIDLTKPAHPLVIAARQQNRLFYVFYKATEEAFGDRPWMLQRIRKVERTWRTADGEPEEKVTWQVEAFKTQAGSLKSPDQHFGSFALRDAHRREIVKEYEIGFGEIPGQATGATWPFDAGKLFHMLQPYGEDSALYDKVVFGNSRRWTLTTKLGPGDDWQLQSPELAIDLPKRAPTPAEAKPKPDATSKSTVLKVGEGVGGTKLGSSTIEDVGKVLGAPLEDVTMTTGSRNLSYRGGLTCNFTADGKLNTIITRVTFAGRTDRGIAHGTSRAEVKQKLGAPKGDEAAAVWNYPGLTVKFDATGAVIQLVLSKG
jgi:hypothetical protein